MANPLMLPLVMFMMLLFGHFLADYPLQGDFIARAKNPTNPVPHVPWRHVMFAHAYIHGAFVGAICWLFTGWWQFMFAEIICHFWIDYKKCTGEFTFRQDQYLHFACKAVWVIASILLVTIGL